MTPEISAEWWKANSSDMQGAIRACIQSMSNELQSRNNGDEYHAELYCGANGASGVKNRSRQGYTYAPATLPYNVVRSAVDTLVAKIAKHRPVPMVLAQRGDWTAQKKARKMTQLLDGEFYNHRVFEQLGKIVVRDAAIFGRGILRVDMDGPKLCLDRVHPWEIYTDPFDDRYGNPQNIGYVRWMDKGKLTALVAKWNGGTLPKGARDAIKRAGRLTVENGTASGMDDGSFQKTRCEVAEVWHLCDDHDDEDGDHDCSGRHVLMVEGKVLLDEPWEHPGFPFARMNYADPITGYDGMGLAEILEGYQFEINQMSEKVAEAHHLMGMSLILAPDNLGITNQQVVNGVGTVVYHRPGGTLQPFAPPPVHPQTYQRLRDLPKDAIADSGISLLSATSQKPAGVESAVAIQALDDIETERFILFGRAYEAWCLDVARLMLRWVKVIANEYGDYAIKVPMRSGVLELSWKDVEIDGYVLKVYPTSLLPQQLPQRLEKLKYLYVDVGIIDRTTFMRLLDSPDLQAELDMETAAFMLVDESLEAMRDADEDEVSPGEAYFSPSPTIPLEWAAKRANQLLCKAQLDGAPEFNQKLIRDYRDECEMLFVRKQQGDVLFSGKSVGGMMPQGPPAAPPEGAMPPPGAAPPMSPEMMPPGGMPPGPPMPPVPVAA